jgi:DNA mismatch repair ATPase MutL
MKTKNTTSKTTLFTKFLISLVIALIGTIGILIQQLYTTKQETVQKSTLEQIQSTEQKTENLNKNENPNKNENLNKNDNSNKNENVNKNYSYGEFNPGIRHSLPKDETEKKKESDNVNENANDKVIEKDENNLDSPNNDAKSNNDQYEKYKTEDGIGHSGFVDIQVFNQKGEPQRILEIFVSAAKSDKGKMNFIINDTKARIYINHVPELHFNCLLEKSDRWLADATFHNTYGEPLVLTEYYWVINGKRIDSQYVRMGSKFANYIVPLYLIDVAENK